MGATLGDTAREFYEGLFFAPHVVLQAIKTSIFAASVFQNLGFEVSPATRRTPQRYHPNDYPKNQGKSLPLL